MGLPGKKLSRSSKRERASHFALKKTTLAKCPKCKKPVLPHHVCRFCGFYNGKDVLKLSSKLSKKEKAKQKKEEKEGKQ